MMHSFIQKYSYKIFPLLGMIFAIPVQGQTLQQAWDIAIVENHSIKAAQEAVFAAEEQLLAIKAVRLPGISFKTGYTARDEEPQLRATLGSTLIDLPVENQYNFACQTIITVPLYTSGRIRSGIDTGTEMLQASKADKKSVLMNLKMQVAEAYITILRVIRGQEMVKSYVMSLEAHEKNVLSLYKQGIVAKNDHLASQVALANARLQMIQTNNHLDLAQAAFNRLLQQPLDQKNTLEELTLEKSEETLPGLTLKAHHKRSELIALTRRIKALRHQVTGVQAEDRPQIALSGGYGYQQNDYLVNQGQWSLTLGLQWNVFDGGTSNHKARAMARQANAVQEQYNDFASIVSLQVRQAWLNTQETLKRISVTSGAITQAEENLRVSRNRYSAGLATNTEVLDAATLRMKSEYNHANARYDRLLAILNLKRVIGEL